MIIGFMGKKGVGKTTAANFLVSNHGYQKMSFAAKLKDLSRALFPFSDTDLNGQNKEKMFGKYDWTPREFMERFGEFMRYWDKDYWLNGVRSIVQFNPNRDIVIDDVRYVNEADFIKSVGGILIRINRYPSQNPYIQDETSKSENSLNDYRPDYSIEEFQNTNLAQLYSSVLDKLKQLSTE